MTPPAAAATTRPFRRGAVAVWLLGLWAAAVPLLVAGQAELPRPTSAAVGAGAALARGDAAPLAAQLAALRAETPELRVAAVTGRLGRVIAHFGGGTASR